MRAATCLIVCLFLAGAAGCGRSDVSVALQVEQAIRDYADAYSARDAKGVCRKLYASTTLPVSLAQRLDVPAQATPIKGQTWERDNRECVKGYGDGGEFDNERPEFTVTAVRPDPSMRELAGITETAHAHIRSEEEPKAQTVALVRYRGDWKVVFEVD